MDHGKYEVCTAMDGTALHYQGYKNTTVTTIHKHNIGSNLILQISANISLFAPQTLYFTQHHDMSILIFKD